MHPNSLFRFALILLLAVPLGAQTVSRTNLVIESAGTLDSSGGLPDISTAGYAAGRFAPLSSVYLNVGFLFAIPDTINFFHADEDVRTYGIVGFDGASLIFPDFLDSPLTWMFFTGRYEEPQTSQLMREAFKQDIEYPRFGSSQLAEALSGSAGIDGTGAGLWGVPANGPLALALYTYWNAKPLTEAVQRNDAQIAFVSEPVRINAFFGTRIRPETADFKMRGDLTASLGDPEGNEFFAQMGLLDATPGSDASDRVYMLFEPRLHRDSFLFAMAFFSTPVFEDTGDGSETYLGTYIGTNFLLSLGSLEADKMRGGLAVSGAMDPENPGVTTPMSFTVNPFCEFALSDFLLESSLSINPFRLDDPATAGEFRVTLKAVY